MGPRWLTAQSSKSIEEIITEVQAGKAERRRQRRDRDFAKRHRGANVNICVINIDAPHKSRSDWTESHAGAGRKTANLETARLEKELMRSGVISTDTAETLSAEQRDFIGKVNRQIARANKSGSDESEPSTIAEWLASEMQEFLRAGGFEVSREDLLRLKEKSTSARNRSIKSPADFHQLGSDEEAARIMRDADEIRSHNESLRRAGEFQKALRQRNSAPPLTLAKAPAVKPAETKLSTPTKKPMFNAADIYARRQQIVEKHV